MFRAMLWKEVREQAAILIALLVLGTGVIATAAALGSSTGLDAGLGDFRAYTNAGRLAVLALTIAAGVVIGGSLFAGELENETMACLEMLPARRWKIWWSKLVAGAAMTLVAGTILLMAGTALGAFGTSSRRVWILVAAILMLVAFGWGTFGSTIARSTLGACAAGLIGSVVFGVPIFSVVHAVLLLATHELWREPSYLWLQLEPIVAAYAVVLAPIVLGGAIFTAPDRARFLWVPKSDGGRAAVRPVVSEAPSRARALFWLVRRQWFVASVVGSALALAAGLAALLEEVHLLVAWPLAASAAGVCGGVFAWTDEQSKDTYKFWGERRLPLTVPWLVKLASSSIQSFAWIFLLFLPVFVRSLSGERQGPRFVRAFGDGILGHEFADVLAYMLVWPLYGFAFGHLAGLLFRKTIVALGVGLLTAAPLAGLWLPSLVTGGVRGWMLWPVPLLVLLSTRLLLRPWTAGRLASVRPIATLGTVGLGCIAFTAAGLTWRFAEVPVTAEIDEDLIFAETVPQLDSDDGGRVFRQAVSSGLTRYLSDFGPTRSGRVVVDPGSIAISRGYLQQLAGDRWPVGDLRALGPWLELETVDRTARQLQEAAGRPMGPIENPRVLVATTILREANEIRPAVQMLLARGLLWQRRGRPDEFVACLDAALAVTRNARTQQPSTIFRLGLAAEGSIFDALEIWLAGAADRPDLVRKALEILKVHERDCPRDGRRPYLADRMIDRNTLAAIGQWAPKELEFQLGGRPGLDAGSIARQKADVETELASFAVAVPWERERFRRILGAKNANDRSRENMERANTWFGQYIVYPRTPVLGDAGLRSVADLHVALAHAALSLHGSESGRPARDLDELVPRHLASVPVDPYSGKPLRYRSSEGERIKAGVRPRAFDEPAEVAGMPALSVPLAFDFPLHEPLAGAIGGLGYSDLPLPIAPGISADGIPFANLDAIGALAGGLVQWPLEELDNENGGLAGAGSESSPDGSPAGRGWNRRAEGIWYLDWTLRWRTVVPGEGIVWSVGPDRIDDRGRVRAAHYDQSKETGDLIRIVPRIPHK